MNKIGVTILKAIKKGGGELNTQLLDAVDKHNMDQLADEQLAEQNKRQEKARKNTWRYRIGQACKDNLGPVMAAVAGVIIAGLTALKISIGE